MTSLVNPLGLFPCPCCASFTIRNLGDNEICPVCSWADDPFQSQDPSQPDGANELSLSQAQEKWHSRRTDR
ncbi:MAG TPA: CPCC family cysteine-rich protein [Verrucomicrobiae bacterium]|nr:CPCC family cysteine-rich protein [Verrucomicrobiae bacterium]